MLSVSDCCKDTCVAAVITRLFRKRLFQCTGVGTGDLLIDSR